MLSELVILAATKENKKKINSKEWKDRKGLRCSGLWPCAYRLYLINSNSMPERLPSGLELLNMEDGWWEEEQAVARLARAGIEVKNRGRELVVGKSKIPGHIDGELFLNSEEILWEHKAMNSDRSEIFRSKGIIAFIDYYTQTQAYMLGLGITKGIVQVKNKETNEPIDRPVKLNLEYITPIIEWADAIVLDNWIPESKETEYCKSCPVGCFMDQGIKLDFSNVDSITANNLVESFVKGKQMEDAGKYLQDQVREVLIGLKDEKTKKIIRQGMIGDKEELRVDGDKNYLQVKKIPQRRSEINKVKLLDLIGADKLIELTEYTDIDTYRINIKEN